MRRNPEINKQAIDLKQGAKNLFITLTFVIVICGAEPIVEKLLGLVGL